MNFYGNKKNRDRLELAIQLEGGDDIDAGDIDAMTRLLLSDLEELPGTEQIRLAPGAIEKGTKMGADGFVLGALLAGVLPKAIPSIFGYLKEWTLRPGNRPIKIKVQSGDESVEVEFDPRSISDHKVKNLVSEIQGMVDRNRD